MQILVEGIWDGKLPYLPIQVFMLGLILSCVGPTILMLEVETLESRGPVKSINWLFLKNERSKDYCKADQNNVSCFFTIHVVLMSFAVVFGPLVFKKQPADWTSAFCFLFLVLNILAD